MDFEEEPFEIEIMNEHRIVHNRKELADIVMKFDLL